MLRGLVARRDGRTVVALRSGGLVTFTAIGYRPSAGAGPGADGGAVGPTARAVRRVRHARARRRARRRAVARRRGAGRCPRLPGHPARRRGRWWRPRSRPGRTYVEIVAGDHRDGHRVSTDVGVSIVDTDAGPRPRRARPKRSTANGCRPSPRHPAGDRHRGRTADRHAARRTLVPRRAASPETSTPTTERNTNGVRHVACPALHHGDADRPRRRARRRRRRRPTHGHGAADRAAAARDPARGAADGDARPTMTIDDTECRSALSARADRWRAVQPGRHAGHRRRRRRRSPCAAAGSVGPAGAANRRGHRRRGGHLLGGTGKAVGHRAHIERGADARGASGLILVATAFAAVHRVGDRRNAGLFIVARPSRC